FGDQADRAIPAAQVPEEVEADAARDEDDDAHHAHDQVDEALRHPTAIADFAAAGELVESQRLAALNELRFDDLENWLNILPASLLYQRPALLISLAWVHFDQLDTVQCLAMVQRGTLLLHEQAHTLSPVTHHLLQAELVALHTALDRALEPREALGLIRQSWTPLRSLLTYTHCNVPLWLAYTAQRMGDLELGLTIVLTTLNETMVWPPLARGRLQHTAGFFYWCGGDLAQAERTFLENLRMAGQYQLHPIAIMSHHGLGAVADARNQLELAESHHLAVVMHPHITNGQEAVMDLYRLIGVYAQRGQPEEARSLVERLKKHALLMGRPYLINQVAGFEAYLALVCGDLTAALRWALGGSRTEMYNGADR
ncbi:MAG TPA: hypothetical protein PKE45_08140, partial [Caldilineaceae bacterium]|nr:hypothetical protein [Caldilineaceae bacterium]